MVIFIDVCVINGEKFSKNGVDFNDKLEKIKTDFSDAEIRFHQDKLLNVIPNQIVSSFAID